MEVAREPLSMDFLYGEAFTEATGVQAWLILDVLIGTEPLPAQSRRSGLVEGHRSAGVLGGQKRTFIETASGVRGLPDEDAGREGAASWRPTSVT